MKGYIDVRKPYNGTSEDMKGAVNGSTPIVPMKSKLKVCKHCAVYYGMSSPGLGIKHICTGNYGPGKLRGLMEDSSTAHCVLKINEYYAYGNDPGDEYVIKEIK